MYVEACKQQAEDPVSLPSFQKIWMRVCPEIVIMKPMTDLCALCQKHYTSHPEKAVLTEQQKREAHAVMEAHFQKVDEERDHYQKVIAESKTAFRTNQRRLTPDIPCSYEGTCHYTFDMVQLVSIPTSHSNQAPCISFVRSRFRFLE